MYDFLRSHQLSIMMVLGSICLSIALFVFFTNTISKKRKHILMFLEISAAILLFADRYAYLYRGDISRLGFYMVRISNYLVYAETLLIILAVNFYLTDLFLHEGGLTTVPKRARVSTALVALGEILLIISQFTGMYYTFDENNHYQRASLFYICYVIPIVILILQLTMLIRYSSGMNRGIRMSLILFTITPGFASILQIIWYGLSLTNIATVGMVIVLYVFVLLDNNEMVERAHKIETENISREKESMQKLFDQTATAFVSAVDRRDPYASGNSLKTAEYAKRIAEISGMDSDECDKVYYAALLHNVGLIGIPDDVIQSVESFSEAETGIMRRKSAIGNEILSSITEYPFLSDATHHSYERFNGTGYPDGLKGEDIPEISRIIAVADAYVAMTTEKRCRRAMPVFMAREALIEDSGEAFDPKYAQIMISIIDSDSSKDGNEKAVQVEKEISCGEYRDHVSIGIPVENEVTRVTFNCTEKQDYEVHKFFGPAIILFDSYDRMVHDKEKAVEAYKYTEYGEIWFDGHSIATAARRIEEKISKADRTDDFYEIIMARFEDHLIFKMSSSLLTKEVTVALSDNSKSSYISLTGENCDIKNIEVEKTGDTVGEGDIPRIAGKISFTDRMESDIKNIQIDRTRSASTSGIELKDELEVDFHTMSLPGAHLIWHCPYVVIFGSDDGEVNGKNYREYGLVKFYGENECDTKYARNSITVKKTPEFQGWDVWRNQNREGLECRINLRRKKDRIMLNTKVMGIEIENTTVITDGADKLYIALTGDQVALTDIRVLRSWFNED